MSHARLTLQARVYVATTVLVGATIVVHSIGQLWTAPVGTQWFILVALTLLTGSFTIGMSAIPARVSVSETFVFASVLLFGTPAGTITVVLETLVMSFWLQPSSRAPHRVLFNVAAPAIAIWTSGTLFYWFSGITPYSLSHAAPLPVLFGPLALFTTLYFLLNTWLVAFALAFEQGRSPLEVWWPHFTWVSVNYFSGASVAALIVTYSRSLDVSTLAVIVPLLVISYLTFRTAMGRVEDTTRHLNELNRLYLSTIETLAMAIDAKDQITHGHIRRVQIFAVGLARRIGITDEKSIKAIEAAALLHDMGKLAVPEYILNKPGKLTIAEFEKMKLHASVGADILSAIDFPYPVVPIVRYHHENWNGTGYPDGLKGTEIPIGARILSVVDCFDALTSDRPYRPRLTDEDAIKILVERRGTMYDPLIVDTFIRVHQEIAPAPLSQVTTKLALNDITGAAANALTTAGAPRLDEIAASADEMLTLYELAQALAGQASISDTGDIIAKHLRRLVPFSVCVFFIYDITTDELEAQHSTGESTSTIKGLKIPLGQRLSGWVAANRQTIVNSDPTLDLGEVARRFSPRLRSCLSTPLTAHNVLVGALTLYSSAIDGFTEDHRRITEAAARQIGYTFKSAAEFDRSSKRDPSTGLPTVTQLEHLITSIAGEAGTASLLLIDIVRPKDNAASYGRPVGDAVLRHIVQHARAGLRVADILFRSSPDTFIALLNDTDMETSALVAARIRDGIRAHRIQTPTGDISVDVRVTSVSAPKDGASLRELLSTNRTRHVSEGGASIH